jgi:uncharacterized membrane protein
MSGADVFSIFCMAAFLVGVAFGMYSEYSSCQEAGGTLVRTLIWVECMD